HLPHGSLTPSHLPPFPTRRSSDLPASPGVTITHPGAIAPTITAQPTNLTVVVSNTAGFQVTVSGTSPFTYQWQHAGTNLPGASGDRKSTRLNSSHSQISYVVFCLK